MGQWVMGHGSWVTASDPLTHDKITAQLLALLNILITYSNTFNSSWHNQLIS